MNSEGAMVTNNIHLQVDHTTELDVSKFDGLLSYLSDDSPDSSGLHYSNDFNCFYVPHVNTGPTMPLLCNKFSNAKNCHI